MTEYLVVFTPHAVRDLDQITAYIAQNNPDAAERFRDRLIDRAQSLSNHIMCHGGGWIPERPGVRKLVMGNYLILYRIVPEQTKSACCGSGTGRVTKKDCSLAPELRLVQWSAMGRRGRN